jgi:hypothetical protein
MNNRRQFLINAGATVAAFAVPSIVRSATPAGRPDYDVASFDVPGLGKVRSLRFASTADRPAISIVAAVVDRTRARATIVTDTLPKTPTRRAGATYPGIPPTVSYVQNTPTDAAGSGLEQVSVTGNVAPIPLSTITAINANAAAARAAGLNDQVGEELYRAPSQLRDLATRHNASIAINGGFFDMTSFDPAGLLIVDGKTISPANAKYSGAFVIDAAGVPSVVRVARVSHPAYAVQSGPFLIEIGGGIGQLGDPDWARRSFVAQAGSTLVAATTSIVSLHQLAELLVQYPDAFEVSAFDSALNLGGAASAGFFAQVNGTVVASSMATLRSRDAILFGAQ